MSVIHTGEYGQLLCPMCGFEFTHVEQVFIAARDNDQEPNEIAVHAKSGEIEQYRSVPAPVGPLVRVGRRHRIVLAGSCEEGHGFAIVFTQHKGHTYVECVPWDPEQAVKDDYATKLHQAAEAILRNDKLYLDDDTRKGIDELIERMAMAPARWEE